MRRLRGERRPTLTSAEFAVLASCARGRSRSEVAADRGVSDRTIRGQLEAAYDKLGATCLIEALVAMGWLRPPDTNEVRRYGQFGRLRAELLRLTRLIRQVETA